MKAKNNFNQTFLIVILFSVLKVNGQFVPDTIASKFKIKTVSVQTFYNGSESPSLTKIEYYDGLGHVIQQTTWNNQLNYFPLKELSYYDIKGRLIKKENIHFNVNYNKIDSTKSIEKYSYNKYGLLDSNSFGKIKYKLNKNNKVIEKIEKTANLYDNKTVYKYNKDKNLVKEKDYSILGHTCPNKWIILT